MNLASHGRSAGRGGHRRLLGIGMVAVFLVTGCGSGGTSPSAAAGDKPYAGTTLHMLMEDLTETHYIAELLPDLEAKTGIKVEFEQVPYSNMYEKLVPQLSGPEGSGTYDVVAVDYYWPGEFARSGWMVPLDDMIAKDGTDLSGIVQAFFDVNGKVDGKTYYIPYFPYPMGIVYRKDLNITIPATMEEYVAYTKSLKTSDIYGAAMQPTDRSPGSGQLPFANGGLYAADLKTPPSRDGLRPEPAHRHDRQRRPDGSGGANPMTSNTSAQGKAATMVTYVTIFAGSPGSGRRAVDKGRRPCLALARATSASGRSAPKSPRTRTRPGSSPAGRGGGHLPAACPGVAPAYTSFYSDPEILAKFPYLTKAVDILANGKGLPLITKQQDLVSTLGRELSEAASKRKTPQEALDAIAEKLTELAGQ
jgi:ABC-type glycerol-3-phosphate transport system substrate-binding protein